MYVEAIREDSAGPGRGRRVMMTMMMMTELLAWCYSSCSNSGPQTSVG